MVDPGVLTDIFAVLQTLKDLKFGEIVKPLMTRLQTKADVAALKELGAAKNEVAIATAHAENEAANIALDGKLERDLKEGLASINNEFAKDLLTFELTSAAREFQNRRSITAGMVTLLLESGVKPRANEVEPDWYTAFYEQCKGISNKEMHDLWSRILAGEISEPGSFARGTLDIARTMAKSDWILLDTLIPYLWWIERVATIPTPGTRPQAMLKALSIPYSTYMALRDARLFTTVDNPYHKIRLGAEIQYGGRWWRIEEFPVSDARERQERLMKAGGELALTNIPLSRAGSQLAHIRPPKYDPIAFGITKKAFEDGGLTLFSTA